MANLEKYEEFLNESDFVNGMKFLTADEMKDLPAYKKMNSRFDVPVFNKSSKTITFSSISRKFTYPFTVSKSGKITYGTLDITPDFSMWGIDFYKSWDSIIDFLEIYMVSMGSASNISQIRSFIKGKKALDPMIAKSLNKKTCDNGDTYFDVLKEKSIKYNGEDKINSMLSAEEKKGEGLIDTLKPIVDSDFFKSLEKNVSIKYTLSPDEKALNITLNSFVSTNTPYYDSFYVYIQINPVKGNKESKGVYLIGAQDEKTMINKFIEHLIKKTSKERDRWEDAASKASSVTSRDGDYQVIALNRKILLDVLTLLLQNAEIEIKELINDSFSEVLRRLLKNGDRAVYAMYLGILKNHDSFRTQLFNNAFTEKELKRLYIGSLYLSNGVSIFKAPLR